MVKKKYESPVVEIEKFTEEDIITTSGRNAYIEKDWLGDIWDKDNTDENDEN